MGSVMVPLEIALLSSSRRSIVTILLFEFLTGVPISNSIPQIFP